MDLLVVHFEVSAQQRVHLCIYVELFLVIAFCGTVYTSVVSTNKSIVTYRHSFLWQKRRYVFRSLQGHHQANLQSLNSFLNMDPYNYYYFTICSANTPFVKI
jgi:hypothetical protein